MQPYHNSVETVVNAESMAGNITSSVVNINNVRSYAIQAVWSGSSPAGSFVVQGSLDNTTFTDISTSSVSGNSGSILLNVELPAYGYVRCVYTRTSGSGTLTVKMNTKR